MPRPKKERGRPLGRRYPPRVDATAEEMAQAMFSLPANREWAYMKSKPEYRCLDCGEEIYYPNTLYRDGRCGGCHTVSR